MVRGEAISARARRDGFSLVELLVVIAIIGVMTGVLLPAVQNARETARRSECVNRLRQIGLAVQNYESARGHLPSGSMAKALPESPASPHTFFRWSALAQAMPYMERGTIYGELDLNAPLYRGDFKVSAENAATVQLMIPDFLCPTDRGDRVSPLFGPTNYAMCAGTGADVGSVSFRTSRASTIRGGGAARAVGVRSSGLMFTSMSCDHTRNSALQRSSRRERVRIESGQSLVIW